MKKVQFRIDENQHDDLLDCLKTLYPDEPALTVAKGMKLLANALLKSKAGSKDINTFFDNNDFIKTTMYLTGKQRADIERAANRHGWTLSRECRYRIQTTLENELDFFDQELLMMNRCRNSIDKIGRNFHYIIVNDQTRVLDKDGFYQDVERLTKEIFNLKNQFENYIMLCKGRTVSNKVEM
ncbi:DNA distortion polypeptide 1 [Escherichia coli]|uniref:DNA distortion polypeptide 1 n=1 Tax=Escherichia albertii TaxID=208962 RepID=A0ABD7EFU7_ESCAL|nr:MULTISPECIES: DNA distortion polypeptide 1 [Escherichia]EFH6315164.1 DNA distortion polypeptide 1 [Escherichia coli]EFM3459090.1 DNA distortion polypeptide 1 [Escherichia coli]EKD7805248.1 DNA distortion polypeptide 1 [Escherichia coli]ELX1923281.1 DNA distortion polypeptide 1 [Escherichia coli]MBA8155799.1 DNA distortion polypeptide 1 [Escherichia coli]